MSVSSELFIGGKSTSWWQICCWRDGSWWWDDHKPWGTACYGHLATKPSRHQWNLHQDVYPPSYTAISRKVVAKTVRTTIVKGNVGYDQYTCSWNCSCRTYFCCFPQALANICPWPLMLFCEISLKNSELKTTHNTFWDCRVHFFRQPFSKQLYNSEAQVIWHCFLTQNCYFFLKPKYKFFD